MGIFKTFKTDTNTERTGRWFAVGEANDDGTVPRFRLARMASTNPTYQAAIERATKDLRTEVELDILTEGRADPVMRKVFIDTILLDWENIKEEDGTEIPFTKENAELVLTQLPDLFKVLRAEASKLANYRDADLAVVTGK